MQIISNERLNYLIGKSLSNLNLNEQVFVFNETIMNIFENFILLETTVMTKILPGWINKLKQKKMLYLNVWSEEY